jgi:hypothetical protein
VCVCVFLSRSRSLDLGYFINSNKPQLQRFKLNNNKI